MDPSDLPILESHRRNRRSSRAVATLLTDRAIGCEEESEHKGMRHEEKRHEHGGNEIRGTLQARRDPQTETIPLIKRAEQIDRADDVEHPHDDRPQSTLQRGDRE